MPCRLRGNEIRWRLFRHYCGFYNYLAFAWGMQLIQEVFYSLRGKNFNLLVGVTVIISFQELSNCHTSYAQAKNQLIIKQKYGNL